jgi:hypothetical protein
MRSLDIADKRLGANEGAESAKWFNNGDRAAKPPTRS